MFWNWINNMVGVLPLPPFLFIHLCYAGWLVNLDQFFFRNRNAPGNLILWPLIIRSLSASKDIYKLIIRFCDLGVNQSPTRGKEIFPSSFPFAVRLHEMQKGHIVKGPGSQREVGRTPGGRGKVTGFNGYFILQQAICKSWPFIGINHQMCSRLCPNGILLHVPVNSMLSVLPYPFIRWESRGQENEAICSC